jgi:hypothetical protein
MPLKLYLCEKKIHPPLHLKKIALFCFVLSGMFVQFFCFSVQPYRLATVEKLTTAFWKLHPLRGGSN